MNYGLFNDAQGIKETPRLSVYTGKSCSEKIISVLGQGIGIKSGTSF